MFILVFIITILILVVIHELGHYFAAKAFNIKVLEFGFGLPPRAWGKKIGETIWSLNWLPFGGFVRLLGEDEVDKKLLENERSFASQTVSKRIAVVVAGVVMNLLLAWVLYYLVLGFQGFKTQLPLLMDHQFAGVTQRNQNLTIIGATSKDSPAEKAGIKAGDIVSEFNGSPLASNDEFVNKTKANLGKPINLTLTNLQRDEFRNVTVTPRENPPQGQGALGVSLGDGKMAYLSFDSPLQKIFSAPIHSYNLIVYSGKIFGGTISRAFESKNFAPVSENVAGPIGITVLIKEILNVKNPLLTYLDFVAALSLNLAIVNILPFPGLDGGRFFFLAIEGITKKKTHAVVEKYVHTIGLAILLTLIVLITISDIRKLFF